MKVVSDETNDSMPTALHRYKVLETGLEIDAIVLDPHNTRTDNTYLVLQDDTVSCCEVRSYKKTELEYFDRRELKAVKSISQLIQGYINSARDARFTELKG